MGLGTSECTLKKLNMLGCCVCRDVPELSHPLLQYFLSPDAEWNHCGLGRGGGAILPADEAQVANRWQGGKDAEEERFNGNG